jgi:hypothetical protein
MGPGSSRTVRLVISTPLYSTMSRHGATGACNPSSSASEADSVVMSAFSSLCRTPAIAVLATTSAHGTVQLGYSCRRMLRLACGGQRTARPLYGTCGRAWIPTQQAQHQPTATGTLPPFPPSSGSNGASSCIQSTTLPLRRLPTSSQLVFRYLGQWPCLHCRPLSSHGCSSDTGLVDSVPGSG